MINIKDNFALVDEEIPNIILDMRYYSSYNFVGKRINGYEDNCAIMSKEAIKALKKVSDELLLRGYKLKIFDAYRPQMAVNHFVKWSKNTNDTRMQKYFYPNIDKKEIIDKEFIVKHSSHSSGSTIDLTLFDIKQNTDLDMGSDFDMFDDISYSHTNKITKIQQRNRDLLINTMTKYGFINYEKEWWHFTLKNEPFKNIYFNFKVSRNFA